MPEEVAKPSKATYDDLAARVIELERAVKNDGEWIMRFEKILRNHAIGE